MIVGKLWFWHRNIEGNIIEPTSKHWYYGIAIRDFVKDRYLITIVPFNHIVCFIYNSYLRMKYPAFKSLNRINFYVEQAKEKEKLRATQIVLKYAALCKDDESLDLFHDVGEEIMGPRKEESVINA